MRYTFASLQIYAQAAVSRAMKEGTLPELVVDGKPTGILCVDCGKPATEYDHRDYFEPLKVEPTCGKCNRRRGLAIETYRKMGMTQSRIDRLMKRRIR